MSPPRVTNAALAATLEGVCQKQDDMHKDIRGIRDRVTDIEIHQATQDEQIKQGLSAQRGRSDARDYLLAIATVIGTTLGISLGPRSQ